MLFSRLIIQAERSHDPKAYFVYELAHEPTSLFKNGLMRKANKALLAQAIKKDARFTDTVANPKCVVDGGSLLHRVKWILPSTYSKIADAYVSYVDKHYGKAAMIVFDGYRCGPTTKDAEHERRASKMMAHVKLSNENIAKGPQAAFLTNKENKAELINLLKSAFKKTGHHCLQASGDADCLIVKAALESSLLEETTVVCDDTDIFVMLLYHYDSQRGKGLNWFSEASARTKDGPRYYSIQDLQDQLGTVLCRNILFMHAWFGCDTTSSIYGQGKKSALKWMKDSNVAAKHAPSFYRDNEAPEVIDKAGIELFRDLYKKHWDGSLNELRYRLYIQEVASSKTGLKPESLPPTESAAGLHSRRVYLQVQEWKHLETTLLPVDWGWKAENNKLIPSMTGLPLAPKDLLSIVRCSCKSSGCATKMCSCRKAGLPCVSACLNCCDNGCSNQEKVEDDTEKAAEA